MRADLIDTVLEPFGNLDQLRDEIADGTEGTEELKHCLFYAWQYGYGDRIRDEHVLNGTTPDPPVISYEEQDPTKEKKARQMREYRAKLKRERLSKTIPWGGLGRRGTPATDSVNTPGERKG